jgi:hypothetical protein
VELIQVVGLPWAVAFTVAVILARVIVVMWRDANRQQNERIGELKTALDEMTEDRNWHRDRLYLALGSNEQAVGAVNALVRGRKRPG